MIILKTVEPFANYTKVEIPSYYKDAPNTPDAFTDETPYYTFNYVYQPIEGTTQENRFDTKTPTLSNWGFFVKWKILGKG